MSDEAPPGNREKAARLLREKVTRLRNEAEGAQEAREQSEAADILAAFENAARRQLEAFGALPCRGEVARIGECSEECERKCERRQSPSCPRSIVAFDAQAEQAAQHERLRASGVPRGVLATLLDGFKPTAATQAVDAWLDSRKRLLLLAGSFGTGKSVAAGYAIKRTAGRWMHASEIAKAAGFKHEDRMAELRTAQLLVIDDVGAEFNDASGWGKAALTTLLLTRYEDGLVTVMTTNLDGKAWKAYADPRVADRLAGDGLVFATAGASLRRT